MPISDKIIKEIESNKEWSEDFKKLLIDLLDTEENNYQFKKKFDNLVSDYMKKEQLEEKKDD